MGYFFVSWAHVEVTERTLCTKLHFVMFSICDKCILKTFWFNLGERG